MEDSSRQHVNLDGENGQSSRWVPVAIAVLAIASVAAEIWGVVRGLSLMIAR